MEAIANNLRDTMMFAGDSLWWIFMAVAVGCVLLAIIEVAIAFYHWVKDVTVSLYRLVTSQAYRAEWVAYYFPNKAERKIRKARRKLESKMLLAVQHYEPSLYDVCVLASRRKPKIIEPIKLMI